MFVKQTVPATGWHSRVVLELSSAQLKSLKKGKRALVMRNRQLYEVKPTKTMDVFDASGRKLSKAMLRRLVRQ